MNNKTLLIIMCFCSAPLMADWSDFSDDDGDDTLSTIKTLVDQQQYSAAIESLETVLDSTPDDADAWNLMGFAQRNIGEVQAAETAYKNALKLDPDHKGALEYQGELFVQQGKLELAIANRNRLAELCPSGCEELDDLDEALAESKI